MSDLVLGVDGGNSKTELVLATRSGRILTRVRGEGTQPQLDGMSSTAARLADLVRQARDEAGLPGAAPIAVGAYFLANVDVPAAERAARREIARLGLTERTIVHNDALAVLRAGARDGWGVAVAAGAGINAVGVRPDGRTARFLALGDVTGDWGGGSSVGVAGLGAAVRAGDGRGPGTALRRTLPAHFGMRTPEQVAVAVSTGRLPHARLHTLAPLVFLAAEQGDPVAREIVVRLGDEVVVMVTALLRRLRLLSTETPVILGGGTLQNGSTLVRERISEGLAGAAPRARPVVLDVAPVAGAVIEALAAVGASSRARSLSRRSLTLRPG